MVLLVVGRLAGAVVVRGLRARGDTTAGWSVRGEGDTVLEGDRVAVLAAGRETVARTLRVGGFGAVTGARAGLLAGADFCTRGVETVARAGARDRDDGTAVLCSSLFVREGLPRLMIAATGETNRGKRRFFPKITAENPRSPRPLPAASAPATDTPRSEKVTIPIKNALICLSSCEPPLSNIPSRRAVRQAVSALSHS